MINNLLVFIPQGLYGKSGYMLGKVIYDEHSDLKKFYIISLPKVDSLELTKCTLDIIGYYSNMNNPAKEFFDRKHSDWIHVRTNGSENKTENEYYLTDIVLNNKRIDLSMIRATISKYSRTKGKILSGMEFSSNKLSINQICLSFSNFHSLLECFHCKNTQLY